MGGVEGSEAGEGLTVALARVAAARPTSAVMSALPRYLYTRLLHTPHGRTRHSPYRTRSHPRPCLAPAPARARPSPEGAAPLCAVS